MSINALSDDDLKWYADEIAVQFIQQIKRLKASGGLSDSETLHVVFAVALDNIIDDFGQRNSEDFKNLKCF